MKNPQISLQDPPQPLRSRLRSAHRASAASRELKSTAELTSSKLLSHSRSQVRRRWFSSAAKLKTSALGLLLLHIVCKVIQKLLS